LSKNQRALLAAVPVGLVLLVVAFIGIDIARSNGEVARNVSAAGVQLGGLGEDDAVAALQAHERELAGTLATFVVAGRQFPIEPAIIGLDIDEDAIAAEALEQRRQEGLLSQMFGWFGTLSDEIELEVPVTFDHEAFVGLLDVWEQEAIANPAFEGGLELDGGIIVPRYPRTGEGIDNTAAIDIAQTLIASIPRTPATLPVTPLVPTLTDEDIDAAAADANDLIDSAVVLRGDDPEVEVAFTPEQLASAFHSEVTSNSPTRIEFGLDPEMLLPVIEPLRDQIEQPPRDARFAINSDGSATLLPGRSETVLDMDLVTDRVSVIARTRTGEGEFPFKEGKEPRLTTEAAEAMQPITQLGRGHTEYPAGQPRVTNIHVMADFVDNAVVFPGETFSLNEFVGPRTEDKGYVAAPQILRGEFEDAIGGGVSQFATTMFNAIFYSCMEDVEHKPHSYYFSRYPEVNEATISWPSPDLSFRNNSDAVVIIKTSATATSITVSFYGNNGGKTCERRLGERSNIVESEVEYIADPALDPDTTITEQSGTTGFTNSVVRRITHPDGTTEDETFTWTYRAAPTILHVHPCKMPESTATCPVRVPDVVGSSYQNAKNALEEAGLTVRRGDDIEVEDPAQDGVVQSQTHSGDLVDAGTTITLRVGHYTEPPPEEPPPDEGRQRGAAHSPL